MISTGCSQAYRGVFSHDNLQSNVAVREAAENAPRVALIAGVTGISGNALLNYLMNPASPGYPWKVYGVARRPQPSWLKVPASEEGFDTAVHQETQPSGTFHYIQCDLSDRVDTMHKLSLLKDVTHLFWVTWMMASVEEEQNVELNGTMLRNTLDAIQQNEEQGSLEHIVLQTGAKYYLGPFQAKERSLPDLPFREDVPASTSITHTLMDITLEAVEKSGGKITWSEHRPSAIFGFAPRSMMNLVGTIATYALICKEDGMPFIFPGIQYAWTCLLDCSDAGLIAEQEVWAALTPQAKNQSFNITNGDVFTLKTVWQRVAERFGLEVPEYKETNLTMAELMKDKAATWDTIVAKNKLHPTNLSDVGHWWFADLFTQSPFQAVMSMTKSRKLGFVGWRDSEESLQATLDEMKRYNIIP